MEKIITLEGYTQSGEGGTSVTYNHRDGHTMLKVYKPLLADGESIREQAMNNALVKMGITTPRAGDVVTVQMPDGQKCNGLLFERIINKKSFARLISDNPDKLEEYSLMFVNECKKLHATPCHPEDYPLIPSVVKRSLETIDTYVGIDEDERKSLRDVVNSTPETYTCLHGDLHIGNIISDGTRNLWIDTADFTYGNPLYDTGFTMMFNYIQAENILEMFHITASQYHQFWRIFTREYFGVKTDEERRALDRKLLPYSIMRIMWVTREKNKELFNGFMQFVAKRVLENDKQDYL